MKKKDKTYGYRQYQDGGMQPQQIEVPGPVEQAPPQEDPQAIAEQFLQAFAQLPPEAQQIVMQTLMQPQQ